MKKLISVGILTIILLCGCGGRVMYCPPAGVSDSQAQKDLWECKVYAENYSMGMAGMMGSGNMATMGSAMGSGIGSGIIQAIEYNKALNRCMTAKGYYRR